MLHTHTHLRYNVTYNISTRH